jgi:hypothetical protein
MSWPAPQTVAGTTGSSTKHRRQDSKTRTAASRTLPLALKEESHRNLKHGHSQDAAGDIQNTTKTRGAPVPRGEISDPTPM